MLRQRLILACLMMIPAAASGQVPAPRFLEANRCAVCHTRIPEPGGSWEGSPTGIGPYPLWYRSAMAQSAVDPYWQARVRQEAAMLPGVPVENECLNCHAPAQQRLMRTSGRPMVLDDLSDLGRDGVTCTVCHQIRPETLGEPASFGANFLLSLEDKLFGPHKDPFTMPMRMFTGFTATESSHVSRAALCGSCHTVITHSPDDPQGPAFLEQSPYIEWIAGAQSDPATGRTCQSCHMPSLRDASGALTPQYIAHRPPGGPFPPTEERSPFHQHTFAGANTLLPRLDGDDARPAQWDRNVEQLRSALRLAATWRLADDSVELAVDIHNRTGHKLPTGYPGRRMWIHVSAFDASGRNVFDSGGWSEDDARLTAGEQIQSHHARIESPEQVQVFEARTMESSGAPGKSLLRAVAFSKDNRILPAGYDPRRLQAAGLGTFSVDPIGVSANALFSPGTARTLYRLPATAVRCRVEVLYQTVRPADLPAGFSPPVAALLPVVMASTELQDPRH
jgi:hypothetical protein